MDTLYGPNGYRAMKRFAAWQAGAQDYRVIDNGLSSSSGLRLRTVYRSQLSPSTFYVVILYCMVLYGIALNCIVLYCIVLDTKTISNLYGYRGFSGTGGLRYAMCSRFTRPVR